MNHPSRPRARAGAARVVLAAALFVLSGGLRCQRAQAITISIEPANQTVSMGSEISCSVAVSGLGDAGSPSLGAFDFDLTYDPSILAFNSLIFGDPGLASLLGPPFGSIGGFSVNAISGLVNQFEVSLELPETLDMYQAGGFVLTTLSFTTLTAGITGLDISALILSDSRGNPLAVDTVENGLLIVSAVPDVHSSLGALGVAVVGLLLAKRKTAS